MEKIKKISIKTYLYILSALVILVSLTITFLVQNLIGYFEFSDLYKSRFSDFWHQPHYLIAFLNYASVTLIPIIIIFITANIFFKKIIKDSLEKMNYVMENLIENNLDFEMPQTSVTEFQTIFETSNKIKNELSQKLIQQWRLENEFEHRLSIMKHELKTPITIAQGHINLINIYAQKGTKDNLIIDESKIVQNNIERFKNHIDETLQLMNDKNSASALSTSWSINSIGNYIQHNYSAIFSQHQKNLQVFSPLSTIEDRKILGDYLSIRHIIDNLVSNALNYSDVTTKISYEIKQDKLNLLFTNDGSPFSKDELAHAFEEKYKSVHSNGSGIGLYFSNYLANKINASIKLSNIDDKPQSALTLKITKPFEPDVISKP